MLTTVETRPLFVPEPQLPLIRVHQEEQACRLVDRATEAAFLRLTAATASSDHSREDMIHEALNQCTNNRKKEKVS